VSLLGSCSKVRSLTIDKLEEKFGAECAVAFAYIGHNDTDSQILTSILASLAKQCLLKLDLNSFPKEIAESLTEIYGKGRSYQMKAGDYVKLISQCAKYCRRIFLIVDGLDECIDLSARRKLIDSLKSLQRCNNKVRLLLASRPHLKLYSFFDHLSCISIQAKSVDIDVYIRTKLESYDYIPHDLREEIVKHLLRNANGM
jgi:hypothetical protein